MFGFGKKTTDQSQTAVGGALDRTGNNLAQHLISVGIDGVGTFDSARSVAEKALAEHPSREDAVAAVISSHTRLAGANGFITNLGGFVTLPVALPANIVGFYTLATRMVAAIAVIEGHDITQDEVRSAILLDLIGADATQVLKGVGSLGGGMATNLATRRLPPAALAVVNKSVAFRIGAQVGKRSLTRIPRLVPVAGGVIGAGMDVMLIRKIAETARADFAAKPSTGADAPGTA